MLFVDRPREKKWFLGSTFVKITRVQAGKKDPVLCRHRVDFFERPAASRSLSKESYLFIFRGVPTMKTCES